jgi:hypothetical protein
MADEEETALPLQPLAMMVYDDGSCQVMSFEQAVAEMERYGPAVRAFGFMGAEFELGGDESEPSDPPF